jgi:serine protease
MRGLLITWLLSVGIVGFAQKKHTYFKLPERAVASDYLGHSVLVKVKSSKMEIIGSNSARAKALPQVVSIQPLIAPELTARSATARGPRANVSGIDISHYFRVFVQPGQNIEEVVNTLYATGYFEVVEPEYVDKLYLTPNDPGVSQQYYLNLIKAFEAWDISQGSDDVVIAIIDTGGDMDHPDLVNKLFLNPNENPNNNTDDDNNGFKDDWQGWDFIGDDTLNVNNPNFQGDNDPSVVKGNVLGHGTNVGGIAGAQTNNGVGIAGVGFNTKLLFTKHTADNQKDTELAVYRAYSGILYAAEVLYLSGKRAILNCSWGGPFRSQIAQDIITYVTLERGALVIGAAGNENTSSSHYPSSYDYVLSVAATDQDDTKANFSNFGKTVDISAPGVSIRTTGYNDVYGNISGTSFSAPIVAGAAALVWAHYPTFTPTQVAEQLRVSADESFYTKNPGFSRSMGKGRLDILRALTMEFPAIRASRPRMVNSLGTALQPGQPGKFSLTFTNYLKSSSSGTQVTISSMSGNTITITKGTIVLGIVPEGGSVSNELNPFELTISNSAPQNTLAEILITYQDGGYTDYEFFTFLINPSFIDIDDNQITTTIASKGRIGFDDPSNQTNGTGFVINENPILFEMGLLMGSSSATIKNNIRGINSAFDQDFFEREKISQIRPGERSYSEVFGSFSDAFSEAGSQVKVNFRSMVWRENPLDRFVIMEYVIKNVSASALNGFRFGIFADWDITEFGGSDKADHFREDRLHVGYIYPAQSTELPMAGIQLLNHTDKFIHYAIDNNNNLAGIPFGLYDGFTDEEKFTTLSTNRNTSTASQTQGNDVSHTVSVGPFDIPAGSEITVAFALHTAYNLEDLKASAAYADTLYNLTLQEPRPVVAETSVCYGAVASITATGAGAYKWYREFTGGEPVSTNATIITNNLFKDTTLYVSNASNPYESVRTPAVIKVKANPAVTASGFTNLCDGQSIILSATEADEYQWSTGAATRTIEIDAAGDYSVTVRDLALACESTSETITVTVNPSPTAAFSASSSGLSHTPINFSDESTDAASWLWQFGNGATSTLQNPTYQYTDGGDYTVTLTVTSANGCQNSISKPIDIITTLERELESGLSIYPNPLGHQVLTLEVQHVSFTHSRVEMLTPQGQQFYTADIDTSSGRLFHQIDLALVPAGMYLISIQGGNGEKVIRKIIKTN